MSDTLDEIVKSGIVINPMLLYDLTPLEITSFIQGNIEKQKRQTKEDNIRAGTIAAAIFEVKRNTKKRRKPYRWTDFFKDTDEQEKPKQSVTDMKDICKLICKAMGGKINGA